MTEPPILSQIAGATLWLASLFLIKQSTLIIGIRKTLAQKESRCHSMVIFERKPYNPRTREAELLDRIEQLEREKSDLEAIIRKNKHEILWLQGMLKHKKES